MNKQSVVEVGNDFIRRYKHIIDNSLSSETPGYAIRHEEANLWYDNAQSLILAQVTSPVIVSQWEELRSSLNDDVATGICRGWHPLEPYLNHVSKCLGFIAKYTADEKMPTLTDKIVDVVKLFIPKARNGIAFSIIATGTTMMATPLIDKVLSGLLGNMFSIELDNQPNPGLGFVLIAIGIGFWVYASKKKI